MRRKYKLIIIILISIILAYFIYTSLKSEKVNLISLGDGIASGHTSYNIDGVSYGDYLKEYFESKNILKNYNSYFAYKNHSITELLMDIENNLNLKYSSKKIQQVIYEADVITLSIGEEELVKLAMTGDLSLEEIKKFLDNYETLITKLRKLSTGKIVALSFYENNYLNKSNVIILNSEISNIMKENDGIFIDISDLLQNKDYFVNKNSYYFNYKAHKEIATMIIHSL